MTLREMLRDVMARVVWIREELDPIVRDQALEDLEGDLAGYLGGLDDQPGPRLPSDAGPVCERVRPDEERAA